MDPSDDDIRTKVGTRIKRLRARRGMSQEGLANAIGMSRSYLGGIETGRRNVTLLNLERILRGLGVTFPEFFDDDVFRAPVEAAYEEELHEVVWEGAPRAGRA